MAKHLGVPGQGPRQTDSYYTFCPNCKKVIYDVWRDSPMSPDIRNTNFCTCLGTQDPIQQQKVTIFDVEDVESDPEVIKEIREMVKDAKERSGIK